MSCGSNLIMYVILINLPTGELWYESNAKQAIDIFGVDTITPEEDRKHDPNVAFL